MQNWRYLPILLKTVKAISFTTLLNNEQHYLQTFTLQNVKPSFVLLLTVLQFIPKCIIFVFVFVPIAFVCYYTWKSETFVKGTSKAHPY